jgi:hypothetical protein
MMPGWSVQVLRDRERDLRALAERRRVELAEPPIDQQARVVDLRDLVVAAALEDPCPEPCLERAG